jgi:hypothetical protein
MIEKRRRKASPQHRNSRPGRTVEDVDAGEVDANAGVVCVHAVGDANPISDQKKKERERTTAHLM